MTFTTYIRRAAALAVIAAAAAGTASASDAPFSAPVEGTAGKTADYAHFAEMLASVMMLREGGVDKAMEAVPMLHDTTQAYIKTMSLAEKHPDWFAKNGTKAGDWAGLKDGDLDLLKTIKEANATAKEDPVHMLGDKIQAKLGAFEDKNKPEKTWEMEKMEKFEKMLPQDKSEDDAAFLAALNAKLAKYNIVVNPKSISAPAKFSNGAAAIVKAITGISLSKTGINFAPCLVSYAPAGVSVGAQLVNVAPQGVGFAPTGVSIAAQGVNIQPALLLVQPIGANVQPQGAQVAPFLIAVSPVGVNVQPQGAAISPVGTSIAPVGTSIVPQGKVYAPVDRAYAPVGLNLTPPPKV